jgi:integrase
MKQLTTIEGRKHMKPIKREGSPFWWYDFMVNGKRHRGSTKRFISDKEAAQRYIAELYRKKLNQSQFGEKPEIALQEAFEKSIRTVGISTQPVYRAMARKWTGTTRRKAGLWHLDPEMLLSEIQAWHLEEHREERLDEGMKPNSINLEVSFLRTAVKGLKNQYNVPLDLDFPMLKRFVRRRYLSETEETIVLDRLALDSPDARDARDLAIFLMDTGVRVGEGLNARWADLDVNHGVYEVYRSKTKSMSLVPLSPRTVDVLRRRHNQIRPFQEMDRPIRLLRKVLHEVCDADEQVVEQRGAAVIHSLRDTYASRRLKDGMTLAELAKLLGHTHESMSAKYGHLENNHVVEKAWKMAGW